ncbi:MAG: glycosyltransferase [Leucobacter sp.]
MLTERSGAHPRVLFLSHELGGGGAERVTVNLANYLVEKEWPVYLLPLQVGLPPYPIDSRVNVDTGIPQGGSRYARGLRKLSYIVRALRVFKPDVVVSLDAGFPYLALPTLGTPFKLVTQLATDPTYQMARGRSFHLMYNRVFANSDRIVFQTEGARDFFREGVRRKGVILSNPLRHDLVHNPSPFEDRDKEIVSFGRLIPQKRPDVLVAAFAEFHKKYPDYHLSMFGDGELEQKVRSQIQGLGLNDVVTLSGFRADIHDRIRNAGMYVLSSDVEGLPNAMLEAMAMGIPSVCTDCAPGGAREMIERYKCGELTSAGDPKALAAAMDKVVSNPALADEFIAAGAAVGHDLSGDRIYEQWAELIANVAKS